MKFSDSEKLRAALRATAKPSRSDYRTGERWRMACYLAAGSPLDGLYLPDEISKALFRELGGDKPARRVGRPADDCEHGEDLVKVMVNISRDDKERARAIGGEAGLSAGVRIALREMVK